MSTVEQTLFPSTKPSLGCASVLMLAVSRLHDGCSASSIRLSLQTGGREGRTNPVRHLLTLLTFQMQSTLGDWPLKKRLPCPLASGWVWPIENPGKRLMEETRKRSEYIVLWFPPFEGSPNCPSVEGPRSS